MTTHGLHQRPVWHPLAFGHGHECAGRELFRGQAAAARSGFPFVWGQHVMGTPRGYKFFVKIGACRQPPRARNGTIKGSMREIRYRLGVRFAHERLAKWAGIHGTGREGISGNGASRASCRPPTTGRHRTTTRPPTEAAWSGRFKDWPGLLWGLGRLGVRAGLRVPEDQRDQLAQQNLLRRPGPLNRPRRCRLFHLWRRAGLEVPVAPRSSRQGLMS
jgi:hypothetical protein